MLTTPGNIQVLYEDNHFIAVNKRPSDIVQGDKTGDEPLSEVVQSWLAEKYNKPGKAFLGVIHRLDRPVSGVVLFAKTSKGLSRMSDLFRKKEIQKTYWATVYKAPETMEGILNDFLVKDSSKNKSRVTGKKTPGAKESKLTYKLIGESDRFFFLEVKPQTGRHHQIRVQLAAMGCIIKGDLKYGAPRSNKDASIHLHARSIAFTHPITKKPIVISAHPPEDSVWDALVAIQTSK